MSLTSLLYRLGSPYDAYVSHVSQLNTALERLRYMSERALGYEAGLHGSMRLVPGGAGPEERVERFRERLGKAAAEMSAAEFEEFLAHLGGGATADVEANRAQAVSRMSYATRGFEEYFGMAGRELALLEARGFNPHRTDVARQLRENGLPDHTVEDYRRILHELATRVGAKTAK